MVHIWKLWYFEASKYGTLNKHNYAEMQGAKYSVALPLLEEGGHYYSLHAMFKRASNSPNTTILESHIRIPNTTLKLGSCESTQGRPGLSLDKRAVLQRKQALGKFTTGVKQWKLSATGHGHCPLTSPMTIKPFFLLFCRIYSKGAPWAPVKQ